jgi:transcriptional regulator
MYYSQDGDKLTFSNFPIQINGKDSKQIELTFNEQEKLNNSEKWQAKMKDGKLEFIEIVKEKTAEEIEKDNLKAKLEAGTATDSDIKEALKILL